MIHHQDDTLTLHLGDCVEVMAAMEPESVDAIVCDPPYGLDFMGKKWDTGAVAFDVATWAEALRVLKPGGTFLAKVIQGGTEGDLLAMLKRDFATVKHVKPAASRQDSAELYVLATGFRGGEREA